MKYPSVYLVGPKASGEVLSVAYAGAGQHQDAGAKMHHAAPETTSTIISKSIAKDGGRTDYRGLVHVDEGAKNSKSFVRCDALLLDDHSRSPAPSPTWRSSERDAQIGHEATVSKVGDEQLFYLMSRGLSEEQAMGMIVNGFIEPVTRTLPDGVRGRVEPADRAADGRLDRLDNRRTVLQDVRRFARRTRCDRPAEAGRSRSARKQSLLAELTALRLRGKAPPPAHCTAFHWQQEEAPSAPGSGRQQLAGRFSPAVGRPLRLDRKGFQREGGGLCPEPDHGSELGEEPLVPSRRL